MAVGAAFTEYVRIRTESSYAAASPEGGADWNIGGNGGGANGWFELPVMKEDELQPKTTIISPKTKSGQRHMDVALPIAGAYPSELGNLNFPFYPEQVDRILRAIFGTVNRTPTAGAAALASTAFASLATLDTQPNGTEQLKFVISSSTAASSAVINIIQSAVTVETITIGTNAGSVDGTYYSKGGYNGTTNAITFTVSGTVTDGLVVVSGVDKVSSVFTIGSTTPTLVVDFGARNEGNGNSEFFPGVVIPTLQLSFDRNALDGMLVGNATILGRNPTEATAVTFANDAAKFYRPFASWTASLTQDGVAWAEVVSAQLTLQPNTGIYATATGSQQPTGKIEGEFEVFGEMTILPLNDDAWDYYRALTTLDTNLTFTSPFYIVDTTPYTVVMELPKLYYSDYTRGQTTFGGAIAQSATVQVRGVYDSAHSGACRMTTVCRMPV